MMRCARTNFGGPEKRRRGLWYYCNGSNPFDPERAVGIRMAFWTVAQQHSAANTRGSKPTCSSRAPWGSGRAEGEGRGKATPKFRFTGPLRQIFQAVVGLAPHPRCGRRQGEGGSLAPGLHLHASLGWSAGQEQAPRGLSKCVVATSCVVT